MALIREHFSLLGLENKVMVSFKQPYCLYSHPKDERKRLGLEGTETYEPHEAFFFAEGSCSSNSCIFYFYKDNNKYMLE